MQTAELGSVDELMNGDVAHILDGEGSRGAR